MRGGVGDRFLAILEANIWLHVACGSRPLHTRSPKFLFQQPLSINTSQSASSGEQTVGMATVPSPIHHHQLEQIPAAARAPNEPRFRVHDRCNGRGNDDVGEGR